MTPLFGRHPGAGRDPCFGFSGAEKWAGAFAGVGNTYTVVSSNAAVISAFV